MNRKNTILIGAACAVLLLVGSNIYFVAQSSRLSGQLIHVSTLLSTMTRNKIADQEYNLRREYAQIQATEGQILGLQVSLGDRAERVPLADFARSGRVYLYFSPNVCEACLYNELEMQDSLHAQRLFDTPVTILASKEYIQNLRAKFQDRALPCEYAVVDYASADPESILRRMNEPLLFGWDGGRPEDIFVPSKINPTYSEVYYRYIQSKTQ